MNKTQNSEPTGQVETVKSIVVVGLLYPNDLWHSQACRPFDRYQVS